MWKWAKLVWCPWLWAAISSLYRLRNAFRAIKKTYFSEDQGLDSVQRRQDQIVPPQINDRALTLIRNVLTGAGGSKQVLPSPAWGKTLLLLARRCGPVWVSVTDCLPPPEEISLINYSWTPLTSKPGFPAAGDRGGIQLAEDGDNRSTPPDEIREMSGIDVVMQMTSALFSPRHTHGSSPCELDRILWTWRLISRFFDLKSFN